jgi:hypothetical protein
MIDSHQDVERILLAREVEEARLQVSQERAHIESLEGLLVEERRARLAAEAALERDVELAEERGAWWAITELPHAGRPGMLPEDRAVAAVQLGRQRRELERRAREGK